MPLNPCLDIGKPCSLCCRIMGVNELKKPRHQWCDHCIPQKGCTIYEQRPQSCNDYECIWLQSQAPGHAYPALSVALKPSVCGALFNVTKDGKEMVVDLNDGVDPRKGELGDFIHRMSNTPMRIFIRERTRMRVIYQGRLIADFRDDRLMSDTDAENLTIKYLEGVKG